MADTVSFLPQRIQQVQQKDSHSKRAAEVIIVYHLSSRYVHSFALEQKVGIRAEDFYHQQGSSLLIQY